MEKFNTIVDHVILDQMSTTECKICQVTIMSPIVEQSHYNSKKHNSKVNAYRENAIKMMVANHNAGLSSDSKFTVPLIYEKPVAKSVKCGVCKIDLNSKSLKVTHLNQFPHAYLLKLKRETLKKGYKDDLYSLHEGKYIYCHICSEVLQCTSSVKSHCQSAKHQTNFNNLDIPVYDDIPGYLCKWFFCKVCKINLDGTSDSDSHYAAFHESYRSLTANTPKTDTLVNTIPPKDSHIQVNPLGLTKLPVATNTNLSSSDNNANIKNQVFMELEKLVQNLYYSNKVPLDQALKYLKKVNWEVVNIIEKAEKNLSNVDQATVKKSDVTNKIDASNDPPAIVDTVAQKTTDKPDEEQETELDTRGKTLLDKTAGKELETIPEEFKTIGNLVTEIRQEIGKQEKIGCKEKLEVLAEIDSLLVCLWANSSLADTKDNFPWQEIWDCLKAFNATVEKETSHFFNTKNQL